MTDPHLWWYITRASAIIGWVLMTFSVVWGILLSTRIMRQIDNPAWLQDLHRYFGGGAIIMVAIHLGTLMLDGWLHLSLVEILVPFQSHFRALPVALGVTAFYLLVAVQGTSLLMRYLPRRFWRIVHYSSYGSIILVSFHAAFSGTDVGTAWYRVVSLALILLATLAVVLRLVAAGREQRVLADQSATNPARSRAGIPATRPMYVESVTRVADGVLGVRFRPIWSFAEGQGSEHTPGVLLPAWRPGSHITLRLPNGLERQYSLCGDPAVRDYFEIAVLTTPQSRGGSAWIHANLVPGVALDIVGPLNHFELEPAASYLFIAGGIGITPIRGMIASLPARREWKLLYFGRTRSSMAFLEELLEEFPGHVEVFAGDEHTIQPHARTFLADPEIPGEVLIASAVYCCGPESLMRSVAELVPPERMHFERFVALDREPSLEPTGVNVTCARSKRTIEVPAGANILKALEDNGLPIMGSCRTGVCGTCEVRVVSGTPEHLDSVMADEDKETLGVMFPCVSRSVSTELVLDL